MHRGENKSPKHSAQGGERYCFDTARFSWCHGKRIERIVFRNKIIERFVVIDHCIVQIIMKIL